MAKQKVGVYIRVSTEKQGDGVGLETQKTKILEYLKLYSDKYEYDETKHFFMDKASGALEYREGLDNLFSAAKNKEIDVIIVYRADRLYRKIEYLAKSVTNFSEWGTTFIGVNDNISLTSNEGKAQMLLFGVLAEIERDLIRDRTMQAKMTKAGNGYYVGGGKPKLGYNLKHNGIGQLLTVNRDEKRLVNKIFRLYTRDRKTLGEVRKILEIDGEKTKDDRLLAEKKIKKSKKVKEGVWDREVISKILKCEMYIGKYYYGRYSYKKNKDGKKIRTENSKDKMVELECPIILDEPEMFWEAKILLDLNKKTRNNKNSYPFAGLIKCGECGKSYNGYKTGRKNQKHDYYRCKGSMRRSELVERCPNFNLSGDKVMEYVWGEIYKVFKDPEKYLKNIVRQEKKLNLAEQFEEELKQAKLNRKNLINQLSTYLEKKEASNKYQAEAFQKLIDENTSKLEELDDFIIQCKKKVEDNRSFRENIDNLNAIKDRYKENLKDFSLERKVELIRQFVEKIIVNFDKGTFTVYFRFKRNPDDNEGGENDGNNDGNNGGGGTGGEKGGNNGGGGHISHIKYPVRKGRKIGGNRHNKKSDDVVSSTKKFTN